MSTIADLKMIRIEEIVVSNTNPRKTFDEKAMSELTESIKSHGILQPILVRPVPSLHPNKKAKYELVCGERRFRASMSAGIETIPCNVRELTHDEAFELQIIENLERKDVHPLDEADAFKKMLDSGKYTIADIAAKMAKTETFVVQRLKLVDLIEEIRKDFLAGHLGIGHAILLARCQSEQQKKFHKSAQGYHENSIPDYGTVVDLRDEIESDSNDLTEVSFDINDENLLPGCGACTNCPKRSGANPVLFPDMEEDKCFDSTCFDAKEDAYILKELGTILSEGKNIPILCGWGNPNKEVAELCKQFNITILKQYNDYSNFDRPGYKKVKGFNVSQGRYEDVFVDGKSKEVLQAVEGGSSELNEIKSEISKIKERAERSLEIDQEKIWLRIVDVPVYDDDQDKVIPDTPLQGAELKALMAAVYESIDWRAREELLKVMGIETKTHDKDTTKKFASIQFTNEQINKALRTLILNKLPQSFGTSHSSVRNIGLYELKCQFRKKEVDEIIEDQNKIATKRIARTKEKLSELSKKLESIEASNSEPKKSKAKKS